MTAPDQVIFLPDAASTLLDKDRIVAHWNSHLAHEFGGEGGERSWETVEALRAALAGHTEER